MKHRALLLLLLICLVTVATPRLASAQVAANGITLSASAGYDGLYREQDWLPVVIDVTNDGPAVEATLEIAIESSGFGSNDIVYAAPISLPTQSGKRVVQYVYMDTFLSSLTVTLVDEDGDRLLPPAQTNRLERVGVDELLYAVVSEQPIALDFLADVHGTRSDGAVAFVTIDQLPDVAAAWSTLDVIIFSDVDSGRLSAAQRDNLRQWVATGGQLVVAGGSGAVKTTAALADMLPVTLTGNESVADLPALAQAGGVPLPQAGPYLVTNSRLSDGDLLVHQDGVPLLAQRAWGQGHVYWLGLDPNAAPLRGWAGGDAFWRPVADGLSAETLWSTGFQSPYSLEQAVSRLPGLTLPSPLVVIGYMVLYIVLVGPVNYWVLRRRGKTEWMWVSVPLLVTAFTALAAITGFRLQGNELLSNQLSVVHAGIDAESARVQTAVGVYAPRRGSYDFILPSSALVRPFGQDSENVRIVRGQNVTLQDVTIEVNGIELYIVDSVVSVPQIVGSARLTSEGGEIVLAVDVQNNSELSLDTVSALINRKAVSLGQLPAGERLQISQSLTSSAVATVSGPYYGGSSDLFSTLLGTPDYYSEPAVFSRFQLLESIMVNPYGPAVGGGTLGADTAVTLAGWTDAPLFDVDMADRGVTDVGTALYLFDLPLTQEIVRGQNVVVPSALLEWRLVDAGAGGYYYDESLADFYLPPGGSVAYEFSPGSGLVGFDLTAVAFTVRAQPYAGTGELPPEVRVWDWEAESWETLATAAWDETVEVEIGRYANANSAIRLLLDNPSSTMGTSIRAFDVNLIGNVE